MNLWSSTTRLRPPALSACVGTSCVIRVGSLSSFNREHLLRPPTFAGWEASPWLARATSPGDTAYHAASGFQEAATPFERPAIPWVSWERRMRLSVAEDRNFKTSIA